jgi:hypothetical protein
MHRKLLHADVEILLPCSLSLLANRRHGKASTFVKLQARPCASARREKALSRPLDVDTAPKSEAWILFFLQNLHPPYIYIYSYGL